MQWSTLAFSQSTQLSPNLFLTMTIIIIFPVVDRRQLSSQPLTIAKFWLILQLLLDLFPNTDCHQTIVCSLVTAKYFPYHRPSLDLHPSVDYLWNSKHCWDSIRLLVITRSPTIVKPQLNILSAATTRLLIYIIQIRSRAPT